jgi:peptide/nickel transport system substrate-binding protein
MVLLAIVAVVAGGISTGGALAQTATSTGAKHKVTFVWGDTSEPSSLNPFRGYLATDFYFWAASYHLLTDFSIDDLSARPGLAEKVDVSPDGMTFTYHIRQGIKWSDGEPLTADDVAWTLNTYKSNHAYLPQGYLTLIDGEVEATDDYTVVFHSTMPTSLYTGKVPYLYDYILPQHIWSKFDKPKQYDNVSMYKGTPVKEMGLPTGEVGSGPFVIAEYKTGEFVRMVRNPYWSGPQPHVDELIYRIYKNEDAEAEALKAGEIDFGYFDSANIFNSLKGQPNIATMNGTIPSFDEIGMNTGSAYQKAGNGYTPHGDGHPALQDPIVRRAIRMAIDSQTLVDKVLLGYGLPGTSIIPPVSVAGARWEPTGDEVIPFDIAGANKLLDDAGYKDTDGDGVREMPNGGRPLEFRYYVQTGDQNTIKVAPFVKSWLADVGIKADVTAMSSGRLGDEINAGTYDLFHWGWIPDPDPDSALSWFQCSERPPDGSSYGNNDSYYCNPEYDKLYVAQRTALDVQERWKIVHQMQKMYYESCAYAVLWYGPILQAYRSDLFTGYMSQPAPKGDLLAGYSMDVWWNLRPVGEAGGATKARGISPGVWIGIVVGLLVVIAAVILGRRSRRGAEERV